MRYDVEDKSRRLDVFDKCRMRSLQYHDAVAAAAAAACILLVWMKSALYLNGYQTGIKIITHLFFH